MQIKLKRNGTRPWVAYIIGPNDEYGWTRSFQERIPSVIHGTGFTSFTTPNRGYIEVGFGESGSRAYYELTTTPEGAAYREVSKPWGKAKGEWTPVSAPMMPPAEEDFEDW